MSLDESRFDTLADGVLEQLCDQLDEVIGDVADVDLQSGILTISLDMGGEFIVNKHGPNRQIWLSSPVSGATHYDYDPTVSEWRSTRGTEDLLDVLSGDIGAKTGLSFELSYDG